MTDARTIGLLRAACKEAGSIPDWARAHKMSYSFVYRVLAGKCLPGPRITTALGLPVHRRQLKSKWDNFEDSYIPEPNSGCFLWEGSINQNGYGHIHEPATGKLLQAHRAAFLKSYGSIPAGLHVLHRCDVPACVNPDHLFLGTAADNARDKMNKGRHRTKNPQGEAHWRAKLTNSDVRAIQKSTEPENILAVRYDISRVTVWRIRARRGWRHISGNATPLTELSVEERLRKLEGGT